MEEGGGWETGRETGRWRWCEKGRFWLVQDFRSDDIGSGTADGRGWTGRITVTADAFSKGSSFSRSGDY